MKIIITGVGGQGTVSLGHLIGNIAHENGLNVVAAETHGMSQRGGSVVFHLKIGEEKSPLVAKGQADVIISGEPMEALRVLEYLKPNGVVITNTHVILSPVAVQLGMTYPNILDIYNSIENWPSELYTLNTGEIIDKLEIARGENLVLLGVFMSLGIFQVDRETVEKRIVEKWPKFAENNLKAINAGYNLLNHKTSVTH